MSSSTFFRLLAAVLLALISTAPARAALVEECSQPDDRGIQRCRVGLDRERMAQLLRTQQQSQWCWAAAIVTLFAGEGFDMEQEAVVRAQFGDRAPDQALPIGEMTRLLNRSWKDRAGRPFLSTAEATEFGGDLRRSTRHVLAELQAGRPLILGARQHAVVLAQVEFERFTREDGIRITGGTVIDPARGQGVRHMAWYEMKPFYVAAVRVAADVTVTMR
jgi:hypothetical protein